METNKTLKPVVYPETDLACKPEFQANSWFAIGHFEKDGHVLNWLFHMMIVAVPVGKFFNANFSVTDETTGEYYAKDHIYPMFRCKISEGQTANGKSFSLECPCGKMSGDMNELHIQAEMPNAKVDCVMRRTGPIIYNAGTGSFMTFLGGCVQQFSMPHLESSGKLTIGNNTYDISGDSWFDRQWQFSPEEQKKMHMHSNWKWGWRDLNLDNGETISVWEMYDLSKDSTTCWGTILHADGSQEVVDIIPMSKNCSNIWTSKKSRQKYPTKFIIRIPKKNAVLDVETDIPQQEIVSSLSMLNKYEAACKVSGTYEGKAVSGYTYVELLGKWK